jgi:hypothetical protein
VSTIHGDLLWVDGGWPGSCHEHELIQLAGLDQLLDSVEVPSLLDRGFRGLAKTREHWHAPIGDRRTEDRLTDGQRAFNRLQAGLRALVEQSIGHLANAWALRRWRGLLYRVRDVFRAAGALICLGPLAAPSPTVTGSHSWQEVGCWSAGLPLFAMLRGGMSNRSWRMLRVARAVIAGSTA